MENNYYVQPTYADLIRELSNQERTIEGIEMQLSDVETENSLLRHALGAIESDLEALKDVPFGLVQDSISVIVRTVQEALQ